MPKKEESKYNKMLIWAVIVFLVVSSFLAGIVKLIHDLVIEDAEKEKEKKGEKETGCEEYLDKLESCEEYLCSTSKGKQISIFGFDGDICDYAEVTPNISKMDCRYTEEFRKVVVEFFQDRQDLNESSISPKKYLVNGKKLDNPLQEAIDVGVCVVSFS